MSRERISVIVNNFDYEDYVAEAIESALALGEGVEVVVVDDGSTDGSRGVIERYRGRVEIVYQENAGQGAAFNSGFAASTGEIVVFLDADDLIEPGAAGAIREAFADPGVAKLHWSLWEVDAAGVGTGALRPEVLMPAGDLRPRMVEHGPLGHSNPPTSGNAFCRHVLERMLPMPEAEYRICADAYVVMLASLYGEVRRSLTPLSSWRRHGENRYNGARESVVERVRADLERFETLAATLAVHLEAQGTCVDPGLWLSRNIGYRRLDRIRTTAAEIERAVPEDGVVVLVDDGDWAQGHLEGREVMSSRRTRRLFDGRTLQGPPEAAAVLAEIKRLEREGATHIVFVWPGAWWLQSYPTLETYLRTRGGPIGGSLLGFDLRDAPTAEQGIPRLPREAGLEERRAQLLLLEEHIAALRDEATATEAALAARGSLGQAATGSTAA